MVWEMYFTLLKINNVTKKDIHIWFLCIPNISKESISNFSSNISFHYIDVRSISEAQVTLNMYEIFNHHLWSVAESTDWIAAAEFSIYQCHELEIGKQRFSLIHIKSTNVLCLLATLFHHRVHSNVWESHLQIFRTSKFQSDGDTFCWKIILNCKSSV